MFLELVNLEGEILLGELVFFDQLLQALDLLVFDNQLLFLEFEFVFEGFYEFDLCLELFLVPLHVLFFEVFDLLQLVFDDLNLFLGVLKLPVFLSQLLGQACVLLVGLLD